MSDIPNSFGRLTRALFTEHARKTIEGKNAFAQLYPDAIPPSDFPLEYGDMVRTVLNAMLEPDDGTIDVGRAAICDRIGMDLGAAEKAKVAHDAIIRHILAEDGRWIVNGFKGAGRP